MGAVAGAHGGTACAKAMTVNMATPDEAAQRSKLTTFGTSSHSKQIRLLVRAQRRFSRRCIFFQLFRRLRGFIGLDPGYGCWWGLWGTALHRPGDALAGLFGAGQRRGVGAGCRVGLRSQVGSGIGISEADMLVIGARLTDCRTTVSQVSCPVAMRALPWILPGCSPEHRILRRRQVKQLETKRDYISITLFPS